MIKGLPRNLVIRLDIRKWLGLLAIAFALSDTVADAQQPAKIPWIGYLSGSGSSPNKAFLQGLRDLGYVEGKNIGFVYRTAEGMSERNADLAAELVRLKVDIIVVVGQAAAQVAQKATSTIPIVMTNVANPVGTKLVASYARPGGNITGLSNVSGELGGKLLDLLREIVPRLSRVAILRTQGSANDLFVKELEAPAQALGIQTIPVAVRGPDDIDGAFRAMSKERPNGLLMRLPSVVYSAHFKRVAELTIKNRLPAISTSASWVDAGGLASYGEDSNISYRRAAVYVDKILKGTKPADLPVEAPMKFELRINLKTAKQIGLTIPPNVLFKADKVIK